METNRFNDDQLDVLKELINMAMGKATSAIADLLQAFGTMHIPKLQICDMDGLKKYIEDTIPSPGRYYITKQLFGGKIGGEFMFVMDDQSAVNLGNYFYADSVPDAADIMDAVIELTNILSSTIISRLSEELNIKVQFFAPLTEIKEGNSMISNEETLHYHQIIIISTVLEFKSHRINGHIFILARDEMISRLGELIDQKLQELYA